MLGNRWVGSWVAITAVWLVGCGGNAKGDTYGVAGSPEAGSGGSVQGSGGAGKGGSGSSAGGVQASGGSGPITMGGSAGQPMGGNAGQPTGGNAGQPMGGNAGQPTGGNAGQPMGGSAGTAGSAGSGGVAVVDPDGVCPPPCGVDLVNPNSDPGFPPTAVGGATLFYDTVTQTFELRGGTSMPQNGEVVVILFTWEADQHGYGEWIQYPWEFVSLEPPIFVPDTYSRPQDVEFSVVVANSGAGLVIELRYVYSNNTIVIHHAMRVI